MDALTISKRDGDFAMSVTEATRGAAPASAVDINLGAPMDRRADLEAKHARIASLLQQAGCDGFALDPDCFIWLASGGTHAAFSILSYPVFISRPMLAGCCRATPIRKPHLRKRLTAWAFSSRMAVAFATFRLVADLTRGRKIAGDTLIDGAKYVAPQLQDMRRTLSDYEIACYRSLGQTLEPRPGSDGPHVDAR